VLVLMLSIVALAVAGTPQQPRPNAASRTWTGCVQAASAPGTYRLNFDVSGKEQRGTDSPESDEPPPRTPKTQGPPYLQLLTTSSTLKLASFVGKRVRVTGRELTDQEAEQEAAKNPHQQEANETSAGIGGTPQRHYGYIRADKIAVIGGQCHSPEGM